MKVEDQSAAWLERLHSWHGVVLLVGAVASALASAPQTLAWVGLGSFGMWLGLAQGLGLQPFSVANVITMLRVVLTGCLGLAEPLSETFLCALAFVIFALDGLDGWWARRTGTTSNLGSLLDMEADAYLIAMLSMLSWTRGIAGAWVLAAGLLRYVYALAIRLAPVRGEAPRTRLGRYGFAIIFISLAVAFIMPEPLGAYIAALGTTFITISFIRSAAWSFFGVGA